MASDKHLDAEWKRIQEKTFTRWCNEHLKAKLMKIENLSQDLSDGVKLIVLLELLSQKKLGRYNKKARIHVQKMENNQLALDFITKKERIKLVNIGELCAALYHRASHLRGVFRGGGGGGGRAKGGTHPPLTPILPSLGLIAHMPISSSFFPKSRFCLDMPLHFSIIMSGSPIYTVGPVYSYCITTPPLFTVEPVYIVVRSPLYTVEPVYCITRPPLFTVEPVYIIVVRSPLYTVEPVYCITRPPLFTVEPVYNSGQVTTLYSGTCLLHYQATSLYSGTCLYSGQVTTLYSGTCLLHYQATSLYSGTCLYNSGQVTTLYSGTCLLHYQATSLYSGTCL